MKDQIIKSLQKITGQKEINLEFPEREEFGDFSSNVALRSGNKNPREYALELIKKLQNDRQLAKVVEKIEVAGAGFINFWLKTDVLVDNLIQIDKFKEKYGASDFGKGKSVIVEYSSPNIAKPFTIGHLRSTIIGDAIANLLEACGWKVLRDNHIGDWGTQFGKMIYAIITWGDEDKIKKSDNPVKELVALYVKFHEEAEKDVSLDDAARAWFKKLEDGNVEARNIWKKCIDWSFVEFDKIYKVLGISFSKEFENGRGLGESFFENRMAGVIKELEEAKLLKKGKEGAKLVFFENEKYPPAMIVKMDGATLYHTRDLATDKYRKDKYNPDLIINEVGSEQVLYFQQLFEIEKLLGWFGKDQRVHVGHGLIRFKDGKMSTRKGNVIWMNDVLKEAGEKAFQKMDLAEKHIKQSAKSEADVGLSIGVGAIKYNDLKRDLKSDTVFDWDEILNMEGNSGPYLQYTVARTNSVLAKQEIKNSDIKGLDLTEINQEEMLILRALSRFSEIIASAALDYSPNLLCNYLYDLASKFNTYYNKHKIIGSDNEDFRILLTGGAGRVLKNGLHLLGIQTPKKM